MHFAAGAQIVTIDFPAHGWAVFKFETKGLFEKGLPSGGHGRRVAGIESKVAKQVDAFPLVMVPGANALLAAGEFEFAVADLLDIAGGVLGPYSNDFVGYIAEQDGVEAF